MGQMLCAVLILLLTAVPLVALAVETGGKAPDFEAESAMGTVKLSDYLGKKIQARYGPGRISFFIDKEGVIRYIEKGMPDNQRIQQDFTRSPSPRP